MSDTNETICLIQMEERRPFMVGTSANERTLLVYDAAKDRRRFVRDIRLKAFQRKDHSGTTDFHSERLATATRAVSEERTRALHRASERIPEIGMRLWDLWPKHRPYYPTTVGAGGVDMSPARRRVDIFPAKVAVPCESHLSPYAKDYGGALQRSEPASGRPLATGVPGLGGGKAIGALVRSRGLHSVPHTTVSARRSLAGISPSTRRTPAAGRVALAEARTHGKRAASDLSPRVRPEDRAQDNTGSTPPQGAASIGVTSRFTTPYTRVSVIDI
uniref:Uncharacterized protein n=1 Tax=Tetraselmis sp. GSL018 TaxID=582737 RepID=A0A061RYV0_9CHLO